MSTSKEQKNGGLTVTIVQTDLHWEDKGQNLRMLEQKIDSIKERTEIVLLPEMFSTGFSMNPAGLAETMDGETVSWMKRIAAAKRIILAGSIIINDGGHYYNRLVWMQPNGEFGIYDKRHRFAYAGEDEHYTAGSKRLLPSVKGWKINPLICYDLRFPVWARQQSNGDAPEYDLLIYVANWPDKRIEAWKTLVRARAIENQCYVAAVNRVGIDGNNHRYTGNSMIVDPMGEILYNKENEEDIFTITLSRDVLEATRERFPFWKDADRFVIRNDE
jgi:predicted amidohydrolase